MHGETTQYRTVSVGEYVFAFAEYAPGAPGTRPRQHDSEFVGETRLSLRAYVYPEHVCRPALSAVLAATRPACVSGRHFLRGTGGDTFRYRHTFGGGEFMSL